VSRTLTPLLAVALLATTSGLRAADEPKDIIARAIKAQGGEEVLLKYKGARAQSKGKIVLPGVGEVSFTQNTSTMLPDKLKDNLELDVAGMTITVATLVNGDKLSIEAAGKQVEITDDIKKSLKAAQHMMQVARLVPLARDKDYTLSVFGEEKVEGKDTIGVLVSAKDKQDITLFFDKKSGLLTKLQQRAPEPGTGKEITEERIILEYQKDTSGLHVPKKILVKHDGKKFLEADVVEVTPLEKIDESEFKK